MAHVVVLDNVDEDIFVCGTCKSVFNTLQSYIGHKKVQCLKPVITEHIIEAAKTNCNRYSIAIPQGEETPKTLETLDVDSNDITCKQCKKKFKKITTLLSHLKTHTDRPYQCPICGRCFLQNSHLQRHIFSHKVWPDGLSETTAKSSSVDLLSYSCSYCSLVLSNYSQFRVHLKNHVNLKKFKCIQGECITFFDNIDSLLAHVASEHDSPIYVCHLCNKKFSCLEDIAMHHQSHEDITNEATSSKEYKCAQCDARFKKLDKLSLHMLTENHKKICIHCNKIFASDKRLRLHLQIHRNFKPFQCNICGSSFLMKKYLATHMLKHGERQFICGVCKFKFKRQDLLQRHMKSHQPRKLFKCPFTDTMDCKKEFSRSDKLKLHIKHHTKRLLNHNKLTSCSENDTNTLEICIVPLDSNDIA